MAIKDKENKENGYGSTDRSEPQASTSSSADGDGSYCDPIDELKATVHLDDADNHDARALTNFQRFAYGVGHVLNDLTASMWFSYMLLFLEKVDLFDHVLAANLVLIGQISDGLCTPFIGFESDQTKGIWKLGRRKTWHVVGTFSVMASFVFLFSECINCTSAPNVAQFVYYTPFVIIFQFGWAATQISHLSYSNDITPYKHERVMLQSIRNSFTVIANLTVYGLLTLLLYTGSSSNSGAKSHADVTPDDAPHFRNLALICLGIGSVFNGIFYFGTKSCSETDSLSDENSGPPGDSTIEKSTYNRSLMTWRCWLKQPQFYQVAILYMATRLYINVSQVFFAIYLTATIGLPKSAIGILPLVSYISSFITSLLASPINRFLGRKTTYVVAVGIGLASCVWMYFIEQKSNQVYGCAVLLGSAGSLLLITSLSMTSDLIGSNVESGAFVFGAMSFTDKFSNGIAVLLIELFHRSVSSGSASANYYRKVQTFIPGGSLVCGFVMLLFLLPQNIGVREKRDRVLETPSTYQPPTKKRAIYDDDDDENPHSTNSVYQAGPSRASPLPPACDAVTHRAEVYSHFERNGTADVRYIPSHDDEEAQGARERKPLLGSLN